MYSQLNYKAYVLMFSEYVVNEFEKSIVSCIRSTMDALGIMYSFVRLEVIIMTYNNMNITYVVLSDVTITCKIGPFSLVSNNSRAFAPPSFTHTFNTPFSPPVTNIVADVLFDVYDGVFVPERGI